MKRVVIIGGGFCGCLTAVNLTRICQEPLRITVINHGHSACRGIAYSTRQPNHLLNVVARNMSALADQPQHFVEWLSEGYEYRGQPLRTLREQFVPRRAYGDYLQSLFEWHATTVARRKGIQIDWMANEVTDARLAGQEFLLTVGGEEIAADKVVLATGNSAPAVFRLSGLDVHSPRYIGDPWQSLEARLPSRDQDLLLIGSGLTMIDVFLALKDLPWGGKIQAVSRSGLLPMSHFTGAEYPEFTEAEAANLNLKQMVSLFHRHYRLARARKINPAILVDKLRPVTQRIWQAFTVKEKRQFCRHLRSRWNAARHRVSPQAHRQVQEAIASGRLVFIKGRLRHCAETDDGLQFTIESEKTRVIKAGAVINCTGPRETCFPSDWPLLNRLEAQGLVQPDELNMGIKATDNYSVVGRNGTASESLYAIGPLLRGTLWETTAVPELRAQTLRLAQTIVDQLEISQPKEHVLVESSESIIEYSI
jgi:uncharacterized NAD(P)/FAD-binding protein YdhS